MAVAAVAIAIGVAIRAWSTPERRRASHERARAALVRAEERLDDLSAEIDGVDAATTNTRRAVRQKALQREARRAVRAHRFQEFRVSVTERLVGGDVSQPER